MDLIEKELVKINFVINQYNDDKESVYVKTTAIITDKLKKIVDDLAPSFLLVSNNSVRKIKHYSFSTRVKDAESLKEKLIRNNLCNLFFPLLEDNFDESDGELINRIKNKITEIDDLIGVKFLTDLNIDCKKMFDLISSSEFTAKCIAQNIVLNKNDIRQQPQQMKNGLDIYKMRGKYGQYNFELQIKSKIISAWGDMEHSILYKDYFISPVRDTTQSSMNHVGKLLFDIDDFLFSIRQANKQYEDKAQVLSFLQWFDEKYSNRISKKLDQIGYRIDGISEMLYAAYKQNNINDTYAERNLKFTHFELDVATKGLRDYIEKRNKIYDLKLLESIILSWILPIEEEISSENIEQTLTKYLSTLRQSAAKFLLPRITAFEQEELIEIIDNYYTIAFECDCNEGFVLNLNRLDLFFKMRSYISDVSEAVVDPDYLESIYEIVFVAFNKGEILKSIELAIIKRNQDKNNLKKQLVVLKEQIDNSIKLNLDLNELLSKCIDLI